MAQKAESRLKPESPYRITFMRNWRESPKNRAGRKLTLEEMVDRLKEAHGLEITHASLSRIERGKQPYSQPILEGVAAELTGGDVASLLIRNPDDPEGIWSVWDQAKGKQRAQIVEHARTVLKTGT